MHQGWLEIAEDGRGVGFIDQEVERPQLGGQQVVVVRRAGGQPSAVRDGDKTESPLLCFTPLFWGGGGGAVPEGVSESGCVAGCVLCFHVFVCGF